MISVADVVLDPDMMAPQPFTILRSIGQFIPGGFQSATTSIPQFGPVQQASDKEILMLPEADRIGAIRAFWTTITIYTTRGYAPVPSTHGETPYGAGTTYTLSSPPPSNSAQVYAGGVQLQPNGFDYTLSGTSLTFVYKPQTPIYVTWQVTDYVGEAASDIILYGQEQYRVLRVYRDPGSGFFKSYGTRMSAA